MSEPATPASETPQQGRSDRLGSFLFYTFWIAFFIIEVYPLSVGPAILLHNKFPPARPAIETFYQPLVVVARHPGPLRELLNWYADQWDRMSN